MPFFSYLPLLQTPLATYGLSSLSLSLVISLALGKCFLYFFGSQTQSKVREFTPATHVHKNNTPTMGGAFILVSSLLTTIAISDYTLTTMLAYLTLGLFGAIGLYDDWCKINKTRGISSLKKFTLQTICAALVLSVWVYYAHPDLTLSIPFINPSLWPNIGYFFILWGAFVMVGTSNAVNLTDGLDGLATLSLIPNFILVAIFAAAAGHYELIPFCAAMVGSLLGFLWYNRKPAQVFMGDIGSLPLGAVLAFLFIMIKKEYVLALSGIVFVMETVSVMLQVLSVKFRNKRIFKMAPFHHHLELCGWSENQIVLFLTSITLTSIFMALLLQK